MNRVLFALSEGVLAILPALAASAHDGDKVTKAFEHQLPNVPGKSMIAVLVDYAPGAKSPAHPHAPSSFIMAYVLQGQIRSQVEGEPVKVFKPGESWYEMPGAHHLVSENASKTRPAKLLAVFVVNEGEARTTHDK